MMGTENKYKKGDWVRVVAEGLHGLKLGEIVRIADRASPTSGAWVTLVGVRNDNGDGSYTEDNFEPWQPKVGERVRFVRDNTNGGAEFGKAGDVVVVATEASECGGFDPQIEFHSNRYYWTPHAPLSCIEPITDTLPVAEPLTIRAGGFYKTRDGRKVGPMRDDWSGESVFHYHTTENILTGCLWDKGGKGYGGQESEKDLVAEWVDTPVTQPVTITAATVDAINDEYGPVVFAWDVAEETKPKFKVGDRVVSKGAPQAGVGIVESIITHGEYKVDFKDTWYRVCTETDNTIKHAPTTTTAIVCKIEDGQPLPATRPAVHASAEAADAEARRLAGVHKGQEFGVFVLTGATHKEARVYEHEWQRLAAEGQKINAIKSLRNMAALDLVTAKRAVEVFIDKAA